MKEKCALFGQVTGINQEEYEMVYEGSLQSIGDISVIPECDVLIAEMPLQSFSTAQKGSTRLFLFDTLMTTINTKRPKRVILQNVSGLLLFNGGQTLRHISNTLTAAGYTVAQEQDLKTSRFFIKAVAV